MKKNKIFPILLFLMLFSWIAIPALPDHRQSDKINPDNCHEAGMADNYVLAVSWQPAFCESHRSKPECTINDPDSYQAKNFTLHGLWPNRNSCQKDYGFCGEVKHELNNFCDYVKVPISQAAFSELGKYMPSAANGSCLERHEWHKHGTCQNTWNADAYFGTAIRLLQEFNKAVGSFMVSNTGKTVSLQSFFNIIDKSFGKAAHERMQLLCSNNLLTDIYINLPGKIDKNAPLQNLIQQARPNYRTTCKNGFKIDSIGQ